MPAPPHCDPAKGVFETLLVVGGQPIELDAHLERLAGSLAALFSKALPADARRIAADAAQGLVLGRLRLTASPGPQGHARVTASAGPIEPALAIPKAPRSIELRTTEVAGGFGAHKWVDRGLLERAELEAPDGALPLLVDRDGAVLEASRANVFAVRGGVLLTPPLDGRIVPGITRRRILELAAAAGHEVREQPLALAELLQAEEAFLTNSVRGVEPVRALDCAALGGGGALSAALAAALRRCWLGQAAPAAAVAAFP